MKNRKQSTVGTESVRHSLLIGKSYEVFGECGYCSICRKLNLVGSKRCQWCGAIFDKKDNEYE